ncbi:MAG: HDIG domain-containing metalloprotein [bacterium]
MVDWKEPVGRLLTSLLKLVKESSKQEEISKRARKKTSFAKAGIPRWLLSVIFFVLIVLIMFAKETMDWTLLGGYVLIVLIFMTVIGIYIYRYSPKVLGAKDNIILVGIIMMLVIILAKVQFIAGLSPYIVPVAMAGMLITVLLEAKLAFLIVTALSILVCIINQNEFSFFFVYLLGSFAGIFSVVRVRHRINLARAGLVIGGINALAIVALNMLEGNVVFVKVGNSIGWGVLNGVLCAVLSTGLLPYLENLFKITTDIRLLELADFNQPLLKRLMLEAPGTYHHSLMVGNLAEAAASIVGANPLLARVGAYYHDIGKLVKPEYFAENHPTVFSKHEDLTPQMSTLILISHVKHGIELAREHGLNTDIVDIIGQHHGTSLAYFFYQKALEEYEPSSIQQQQYRYPGPRPRSREAAIIMLADGVEAASRVLEEPTYPRLQELVRKIINNRFIDAQLDECDLTLKDLHLIGEKFVFILTSMFHARVEYPEENPEKESNK